MLGNRTSINKARISDSIWPEAGPKMAPRWPQVEAANRQPAQGPQKAPRWPNTPVKCHEYGGSKQYFSYGFRMTRVSPEMLRSWPEKAKQAPRWPQEGSKITPDGPQDGSKFK